MGRKPDLHLVFSFFLILSDWRQDKDEKSEHRYTAVYAAEKGPPQFITAVSQMSLYNYAVHPLLTMFEAVKKNAHANDRPQLGGMHHLNKHVLLAGERAGF